MSPLFFYIFTALAVAGAVALVCFRNPVSSAMSMVASFIGLAALFVGLNAYFVGVIQILVYAGAIMVLFVFIIMLLDIKAAQRVQHPLPAIIAALVIPAVFIVQLLGVLQQTPSAEAGPLAFREAAEHFEKGSVIHDSLADPERPSLPDVHLVGRTLFQRYNFPLQVVGVLLLVATVGVVALSRKSTPAPPR